MLKVNTLEDIRRIGSENLLPKPYVEELERYFKEVVESITGEKIWSTYNIEGEGSILILQKDDDIYDYKELGLTREYGGIFGATPEFADIIEIEGMKLFRIVVVCDNSCAVVIFAEAGQLGEEFDEWIMEYLS